MKIDKFYMADQWLKPFVESIERRYRKSIARELVLRGENSLIDFARGHHYYGLHRESEHWVFREWAPNASEIFLTGTFTGWKENNDYRLKRINEAGDWEIILPPESLRHEDLYKL
jgi:1,4-alpha-glucan branching enzyme